MNYELGSGEAGKRGSGGVGDGQHDNNKGIIGDGGGVAPQPPSMPMLTTVQGCNAANP